MSTSKLLVVIGATGVQGSSLISHFQTHPLTSGVSYRIRGLTRNPLSASSLALSERGVEIMQADLLDRASLISAFQGAHTIFAYTDYAGFAASPAAQKLVATGEAADLAVAAGLLERRAGENIAEAAAVAAAASVASEGGEGAPTLERLVWSSTQDAERWSHGRIVGVHEMQSKAWVREYMLEHPGLRGKVSSVLFGVFVDVLVRFPETFGWKKRGEGKYVLRIPVDKRVSLPWIDMREDAGSWVAALLEAPAGTHVEAVGGRASFEEIADLLARKFEASVDVESISVDEYAEGDDTGLMRQLALLFRWVEEEGIRGEDPEFLTAKELAEKGYPVKQTGILQSFERMDLSSLA